MKRYTNIKSGKPSNPISEENVRILFGGIMPSDEVLNSKGFYEIQENYTATQADTVIEKGVLFNNGVATLNVEITTDINKAKELKKEAIKPLFKAATFRPRIDTTLGFSVDGSKDDLVNLENAQKLGVDFVKDADGVTHKIDATTDWDTILNAVRQYGLALYKEKWELENSVDACTTVDELNAISLDGIFGAAVAEKE